MCGINAVRRFDRERVEPEALAKMCSVLSHRGPDEAGFTLLDGGRTGLAHVRLSIIDLASGHQPMFNEDGSVAITFNGEIYDYKQHREQLMKAGHVFQTCSDTEVLLHLYEQHGLDFFSKLNGEFAFVIWDQNKKRLLAGRDRFGIKPLFYHVTSERIAFSSECKGLLALEDVSREVNPDFMVGPFFGSFVYGTTFFKNIRDLKPGHFLIVDQSGVHDERPYWEPSFKVDDTITPEIAKEGVRELFTRAVKRRMVADVPVGSYLSGGLDSTLVCALMARETGQLKSFNIGFGETEYDESRLARKIAEHYGAKFESINCDPSSLASNFARAIYHIEQPVANPNSIAKVILSGMVRSQGYKVCLTGEGSDEVFGGYAYFKLESIWRLKDKKRAKELLRRFKRLEKHSRVLLWHDWKKTQPLFGYASFHQIRMEDSSQAMLQVINPDLIGRATKSTPLEFLVQEFGGQQLECLDPFNASKFITYSQLTNYIIPTLGDRVEMANSVECRTPFLDKDLVEFVQTVPPEHFMRIDELREKLILREAFADLLPEFLSREHKHPFLSPNWWRLFATTEGARLYSHLISSENIKRTAIFNAGFVRQLRFYWSVLPSQFVLWKRIDVLMGMILSVQLLHEQLIENRPQGIKSFKMFERSAQKALDIPVAF